MHHHPINDAMLPCIDACQRCHVSCLSMATGHCRELGGAHAEPAHIKLMLDCAQICAVAVEFMVRQSAHHAHICRVCAEICRACEASCRALEGMEDRAEACRRCAEECEKMASAM